MESGNTQFVLDDFVFLQLHLVEKAACLMLTRQTQDLFLPAFVPSTLWRHIRTQAPEWAEEQVSSHSDGLLPTFDAANAEYWGAGTDTFPTLGNMDAQLSSLFAKRVLRAAQTPLSAESGYVVMKSMSGLTNSISIATHLAELVQIPDGPALSTEQPNVAAYKHFSDAASPQWW